MCRERLNVAITGTLSKPRAEIAALIDATRNGQFAPSVNLHTHYLVCAKPDSQKARRAALYGTAVITEAVLREYLEAGAFPSTALPRYTPHHPNNFPDIHWAEIYHPARRGILTYCDAAGNLSIRTIIATAEGTCQYAHRWLAAYDGPDFRTFRWDRIINLEPTPEVE